MARLGTLATLAGQSDDEPLVNLAGESPVTLEQRAAEAQAAFRELQKQYEIYLDRRSISGGEDVYRLAPGGRVVPRPAPPPPPPTFPVRPRAPGEPNLPPQEDYIRERFKQIGRGAQELKQAPYALQEIPPGDAAAAREALRITNLQSPVVNQAAQGVSDIAAGATPLLAPLGYETFAAAPIATLIGLGGGMAAQAGAQELATQAGLPSGVTSLIGDVAGFGGGVASEELAGALPGLGRGLRGILRREPTPEPIPAEAGRLAVARGPGGELPAAAQAQPARQKRPASNRTLQGVANDYNARNGLPPVDHSHYHPLDQEFAGRIADAYDALKDDNSADPRVSAAYQAFARETKAQYDHLVNAGYTFEPWRGEGQPYANSHEMVKDLNDNKHLWFFTGGEPHPFMSAIDPETGLSYNELFRAVHDVWGHATGGYGFGPRGEEMAHDTHSQSFSPLARQAMTTETRGQNSWVNFGRHNYDAEGNHLNPPVTERPYAKQKVDLLPQEFQQRTGERVRTPAPEPEQPGLLSRGRDVILQASIRAHNLIDRLEEAGMGPEAGALRSLLGERDVKARTIEDLDRRIPQEIRVVSPDATKTIDGRQFHDLDLDAPGEGFLPLVKLGEKQAQEMLERAWGQAVKESEIAGGTAARDAVKKTGARPPTASFFHKAFSLAKRARYWYELSAEAFTGKYFNVRRQLQPRVIDATAGTSGGVEPGPNQQRAIGILSEDMQGVPVMTDLRDPASARNALSRIGQALRTLKYRSFGGTMKFLAGLSKERPLTTNDVQVASMFGIKGEDIGKNPVLYEVLSRFFIKLRDMQNAHLESGAQPWETWQMQAPAWVYERALKNPAKAAEYDDYSLVLPKLIALFQQHGVPTPGGKITEETLMDPRVPNLMSGTRERFLSSPVATIEVGSKLTPEGAAAADLHQQLKGQDPNIPWVRDALAEHEQIQRNVMSALAKRKGANKKLGIEAEPSLISKYVSAITGKKVDVSRIDRTGYGIFERELSPNLRVPVTGRAGEEWITLTDVEHEALLAMLGQDLNQKAMGSSLFQFLSKDHPAPDTYSIFLQRYDGVVDQKAITQFSNQIGHSVNVSQVPNGVLIDINMEHPKGQPRYGPRKEAVESAANAIFGRDAGIEEITAFNRSYDSKYVTEQEYEGKINAWRNTQRAAQAEVGRAGRGGRARARSSRAGDLARVRQKVQSHARVRDRKFADWTETNRAKLDKHLEKERLRNAIPVGPQHRRAWFFNRD